MYPDKMTTREEDLQGHDGPCSNEDRDAAIVVLGHRTRGELLSEQLVGRVDVGTEVHRECPERSLILAGGPDSSDGNEGDRSPITETAIHERIAAEVQSRSLDCELGVAEVAEVLDAADISFPEGTVAEIPESRVMEAYVRVANYADGFATAGNIYREEHSESTVGNAYYVWRLLDSEALDVDALELVTSEYHSLRAEYIFESTFPERYGVRVGDTYSHDPRAENHYEDEALLAAQKFFKRVGFHAPEEVGDNLDAQYDKSYREKLREDSVSIDLFVDLMSHRRRRLLIELLAVDESVTIDTAARHVADIEDEPVGEVRRSLFHVHVPRLHFNGIVHLVRSEDVILRDRYYEIARTVTECIYRAFERDSELE